VSTTSRFEPVHNKPFFSKFPKVENLLEMPSAMFREDAELMMDWWTEQQHAIPEPLGRRARDHVYLQGAGRPYYMWKYVWDNL
jgi:hypothetical protein